MLNIHSNRFDGKINPKIRVEFRRKCSVNSQNILKDDPKRQQLKSRVRVRGIPVIEAFIKRGVNGSGMSE